ncbi:MAG TPA: ribonuclease H-like domain-containing protein [Patescibacteria group bacterium]|nr:ribonuclease H-like domain-containing protein [Patescibacteria group bacterium]
MGKPVVLDLETKKSFREVERRKPEDLGVSVVGTYSYASDEFRAFREEQFDQLFRLLESASLIIGFNITEFDLPVLRPYYVGDLMKIPRLDLLTTVHEEIGRRIALNEFARETLKTQKSGHGLQAINYYNEGKWDELIRYCLDDVRITRDLYEYGKEHGEIYYLAPWERRTVKVDWSTSNGTGGSDVNLTLGI